MTTLAIKGAEISADTMIMFGEMKVNGYAKITRHEDEEGHYAIGGAGDVAVIQRIIDWYNETDRDPDEYPIDDGDGLSEVVVLRADGSMLHYAEHGHPVVMENIPYFAMGSGEQAAMAAMLMGAGTKRAIEVASQIDPGTGVNVTTINLKEKKK